MLHQEIRCLCSQIAKKVLSNKMEKHGTHLPDGAVGDEIMQAIGIMDGPITTALQDGGAPEVLEPTQLHRDHIDQVNKNDRKGLGRKKARYHPLLMNSAIARVRQQVSMRR
jgi:hypothetical protein